MWNPRVKIVILQYKDEPIANLTFSEFEVLIDGDDIEMLSAPNDPNVKIGVYNLDLRDICSDTWDEAVYAYYLAHWAKSGDVKDAMAKTAMDMGGSGPSVIDLLAMSYDMKDYLHPKVSDTLIDHLISIIQASGDNDGQRILKEWCTAWNLVEYVGPATHGTHRLFANYIFHNHYAEVSSVLKQTSEGQRVAKIVNAWKRELWKTKDWSVVPQDIQAQDFNDHCRYHCHKGRCWKEPEV